MTQRLPYHGTTRIAQTIARSLVAVALVASIAHAGNGVASTQFEVTGDADSAATDSRTLALDVAFAAAVDQALEELLTAAERKAKRSALDKEVIARARLWVASFSVKKDTVTDGRRVLSVAVKLNSEKLNGRLVELGFSVPTEAEKPAQQVEASGKNLTILARVQTGNQVVANFGAAAQSNLEVVTALARVLSSRGYKIKTAPATGQAVGRGGDLPVGDEQAQALALDAKADSVVIVDVTALAPTQVRGANGEVAVTVAIARWVNSRTAEPIALLRRVGLATGSNAASESQASAIAELGGALRGATQGPGVTAKIASITAQDVALPTDEGGALVIVAPGAASSAVSSLAKSAQLTLLSASPHGFVLRSEGQDSPAKVMAKVKKVVIPNRSLSADLKKGYVRVVITSAAPPPPTEVAPSPSEGPR